jgi:hypothetical protein
VILLEHSFEGPFNSGCYDVRLPGGGTRRVSGRQASMISMILAGYEFKDGFLPMEAFTEDSLAAGRADAKVVNADAGTEVAEGASAA